MSELVRDVLGTHRGCWMSVPEIAAIALRVRPSVNEKSLDVVAKSVSRSFTSVERRFVVSQRDWQDRVVAEDVVELRVIW